AGRRDDKPFLSGLSDGTPAGSFLTFPFRSQNTTKRTWRIIMIKKLVPLMLMLFVSACATPQSGAGTMAAACCHHCKQAACSHCKDCECKDCACGCSDSAQEGDVRKMCDMKEQTAQ